MLLKSADDKTKRVRLLEDLQKSNQLDTRQRDWLKNELDRLRKGMAGEKAAAHYLDNYLADGKYSALLHDLRFEVDGEVAQIDHLWITRGAGMVLFETKNFSGNLRINEHGEFSVNYGSREYGIPSPLEQSRRHANVMQKLLDKLEITSRIGKRMDFRHVVLVDPKATITRPAAKAFDTSMVIKADQFADWHKRYVDEDVGVLDVVKTLGNLRSPETVKAWGEKLLRQHRPADLLKLPDFMAPKNPAPIAASAPVRAVQEPGVNYQTTPTPSGAEPPSPDLARKLICAHCRGKISFAEGKFCWNNERRFAGLQYCREHQTLFQ
ncbi:nuclease-related domain-containing protein [Hydrogenophaga sp.]|uniref:nuclease-related domain-containing protein n=1 Tax=Hydrogenophaga sp. TaxID=1904254 RepID=UPI0035B25AB6